MLVPSVDAPTTVASTSPPPASAPAPASATQTATTVRPSLRLPPARSPDGTLRLRGGPAEDRRVRWDQDVIDNEGMGKKKSKVCCIYHRPRAYDESSSEDDDSSDDSSSDESDRGGSSNHGSHRGGHRGCSHGKKPVRKNAYEKMPRPSSGFKRKT